MLNIEDTVEKGQLHLREKLVPKICGKKFLTMKLVRGKFVRAFGALCTNGR